MFGWGFRGHWELDRKNDQHIDEILKNPDLVWKNKDISPTQRGRIIEEIKARTEYKNYGNVGKAKGGNFEAIDFANSKEVIQLKTLDTNAPSYTGDKVYRKIEDYARELSGRGKIRVEGKEVTKILDITVPKGSNLDDEVIKTMMKNYPDVKIKIKEF